MALAGTLKDFSLADIFQLIGLQKKTGILSLKSEKLEARVTFMDGAIVGAETSGSKLESRLGHVLVKTSRITASNLERALEIQNKTLQRLGQILITQDFITQKELSRALQTQVCEIVYKLFRWTDSEYYFRPEKHVDFDQDNITPITAESVLLEGIRMVDEWPMIEKVIPSFDILVERTDTGEAVLAEMEEEGPPPAESHPDEDFDFSFDKPLIPDMGGVVPEKRKKPKLYPEQVQTLKLIDGPVLVQEVRDCSRLNEFDCCRSIYDLIQAGYVQVVISSDSDIPIKVIEEREMPVSIPIMMMALLAAISFFVSWNPLNPLFPSLELTRPSPDFLQVDSSLRLQRVEGALFLYYVQKGSLPVNLSVLTVGGELRKPDLKDTLGRPFKYERRPADNGFTIYGLDSQGRPGTGLLRLQRNFPPSSR